MAIARRGDNVYTVQKAVAKKEHLYCSMDRDKIDQEVPKIQERYLLSPYNS